MNMWSCMRSWRRKEDDEMIRLKSGDRELIRMSLNCYLNQQMDVLKSMRRNGPDRDVQMKKVDRLYTLFDLFENDKERERLMK